MQGATVYVNIPNGDVGHFLHLLEAMADVFVVSRLQVRGQGCEAMELRSDRFPAEWNHQEVRVDVTDDVIERFVPVIVISDGYHNGDD